LSHMPCAIAIATARADAGWNVDVRNASSGKPHLAGTVR
jgi:hypothetical protein